MEEQDPFLAAYALAPHSHTASVSAHSRNGGGGRAAVSPRHGEDDGASTTCSVLTPTNHLDQRRRHSGLQHQPPDHLTAKNSRRSSQTQPPPPPSHLSMLRTSSTASTMSLGSSYSNASYSRPTPQGHAHPLMSPASSRASSYSSSSSSHHASPHTASSSHQQPQVRHAATASPALRPLAQSLETLAATSHGASGARQADSFLTAYSLPHRGQSAATSPLASATNHKPLSSQPSAAQQLRGFVQTDTQASMMAGMLASWGGGSDDAQQTRVAPAAHLAIPRTSSDTTPSAAAGGVQKAPTRGHHRTLTVNTDIKRARGLGREEDVVSVPIVHVSKKQQRHTTDNTPLPPSGAPSSSVASVQSSTASSPLHGGHSRMLSDEAPQQHAPLDNAGHNPADGPDRTVMSPNTVLRMLAFARARGLPAHHSRATSNGSELSVADLLEQQLVRDQLAANRSGSSAQTGDTNSTSTPPSGPPSNHSISEQGFVASHSMALNDLPWHAVSSASSGFSSAPASVPAHTPLAPFEFSPLGVRGLAESYLSALNGHSVPAMMALFCEDSSVGDRSRGPAPSIHAASVRTRWGIPDGHLSGRLALGKHWTKGFDPVSGDDAHAHGTFVAALPGPKRTEWCVLYHRMDGEPAAQLVAEWWELTEEGRIRSARVTSQPPTFAPTSLLAAAPPPPTTSSAFATQGHEYADPSPFASARISSLASSSTSRSLLALREGPCGELAAEEECSMQCDGDVPCPSIAECPPVIA